MKKISVTLFTFLVITASTTFAEVRNEIDPRILSAFQKEFSFATNVKWDSKGDLTQVSFIMNEQGVIAWYDSNAELVTIARNMLYNQLPISVIRSLEKEYAGSAFYAIVEVTHNNETHYQVTAEKKNKKILLKASPSGDITVIKRIK